MIFDKEINLTKVQESCVNADTKGDLLIKGVAGSGKSLVIMNRALAIYKKYGDSKSIKIFTYANTLVKYTHDCLYANLKGVNIEVLTVDSYFRKLYLTMSGRRFFKAITEKEYSDIVKASLDEYSKLDNSQKKNRLYDADIQFWKDEFRWIRERCIRSLEGYEGSERKGRGSNVRVLKSDRSFIWAVYSCFIKNMAAKKKMDWCDIYMYLYQNRSRIPENWKVDYILLDEAQDLTLSKIALIKAITRDNLTIAADLAQKIYKTSFTWKEAGVDITGSKTRILAGSFRSTKEIVLLAEGLMEANRRKNDGTDYTEPVIPQRSGRKPILVSCKTTAVEKNYLISFLKTCENAPRVTGVICYSDNDVRDMRKLLDRNLLKYEEIDKKKIEEAEWTLLKNGIKIVKAHSSKGLEFDTVVIPYLNEGRFPFKPYNHKGEFEEEYIIEQRNLLYVAMTRAREDLLMLCDESVRSRFIDEFDTNLYEEVRK